MANAGPTQEWTRAKSAEVMARYNSYRKPPNPFTNTEKGMMFDGPIPSSRNKEVQYHVIVTPTSSSCTCPAWTQYHRGRDCSHITLVKEALAQ